MHVTDIMHMGRAGVQGSNTISGRSVGIVSRSPRGWLAAAVFLAEGLPEPIQAVDEVATHGGRGRVRIADRGGDFTMFKPGLVSGSVPGVQGVEVHPG